jgi:hypothetical protein
MLAPLCHEEAVLRLYEMDANAEKNLFRCTALAGSIEASPRPAPLSRDSPMEIWINDATPSGWGFYLASDAPFDEILAHLRSLLIVKRAGENLVFRFRGGRILTRICKAMPEDIPRLLGPIRRILTQDDEHEWVCIDRDGEAFMAQKHRPGPLLPSPWYAFTDQHERLFHVKRPRIVAGNIVESLFSEKRIAASPCLKTRRSRLMSPATSTGD